MGLKLASLTGSWEELEIWSWSAVGFPYPQCLQEPWENVVLGSSNTKVNVCFSSGPDVTEMRIVPCSFPSTGVPQCPSASSQSLRGKALLDGGVFSPHPHWQCASLHSDFLLKTTSLSLVIKAGWGEGVLRLQGCHSWVSTKGLGAPRVLPAVAPRTGDEGQQPGCVHGRRAEQLLVDLRIRRCLKLLK